MIKDDIAKKLLFLQKFLWGKSLLLGFFFEIKYKKGIVILKIKPKRVFKLKKNLSKLELHTCEEQFQTGIKLKDLKIYTSYRVNQTIFQILWYNFWRSLTLIVGIFEV